MSFHTDTTDHIPTSEAEMPPEVCPLSIIVPVDLADSPSTLSKKVTLYAYHIILPWPRLKWLWQLQTLLFDSYAVSVQMHPSALCQPSSFQSLEILHNIT